MASLNPKTGTLGRRLAAHLLRRTTFVPTRTNIDIFSSKTISQAVDDLMVMSAPTIAEPQDPSTGQTWISSNMAPSTGIIISRNLVISWWLNQARLDLSIGHKMMLFLHANFVVAASEGTAAEYFDYLALLRYYALGDFKTLAKKMIIDNQMLRYLDNMDNKVGNPNENFAREFFELFTIGKGPQIGAGNYTNFTEADIVEAARLLTGITINPTRTSLDADTGIPRGVVQYSQHDTGDKTFSAAFQNLTITGAVNGADVAREVDDFVNMVFAQAATAKHICRKLYHFFVSRNITTEIENDIIDPLATHFRNNNYDLKSTLQLLLKSEHFYDSDDSDNTDEIIGGLVKSPLELVLQSMNYFGLVPPDESTNATDHYLRFYTRGLVNSIMTLGGMNIFRPTDVAGYPAYYQAPDYTLNWINSSTLIARYKLSEMWLTGQQILSNQSLGGVQLDFVAFVDDPTNISNPSDATILVGELVDYLFPESIDTARMNYFINDVFLDNLPPANWTTEWNNYLNTNDNTNVKIPLEKLFHALLYSQEYQTM